MENVSDLIQQATDLFHAGKREECFIFLLKAMRDNDEDYRIWQSPEFIEMCSGDVGIWLTDLPFELEQEYKRKAKENQ